MFIYTHSCSRGFLTALSNVTEMTETQVSRDTADTGKKQQINVFICRFPANPMTSVWVFESRFKKRDIIL